jgi:hypothetical protein
MPIGISDNRESVTMMFVGVELPAALRTLAFGVSEYEISGSVPLDEMESALRALPLDPPASTPTPPYAPLSREKLRPIPADAP